MDKRVAVIAVHGVADQQPGDTARAVVALLVSSAPEGTCYTSASSADLTLRVPPLEPQPTPHRHIAHAHDATPKGEDRSPTKAFVQSLRSDFQREAWAAPKTMRGAIAERQARRKARTGDPEKSAAIDRGIAVSNYLLTKHRDNGARPEAWDTTRIDLLRHDVGPDRLSDDSQRRATRVDVFEMYWADLSRLSGAMPRIVSELFTMVFRMSKLGRETVDEMWGMRRRHHRGRTLGARVKAGAWNVAATLQIGLDWLFVNGLALLFTQLALLALVFVGLGFASGLDDAWLHRGVATALALFALLRFLYRRGDGRPLHAAIPVAVCALAVAALALAPPLLQWLTALTLLAAVTAVNEIALRIADDRFPFVHVVGRWMWAGSAVLMLASAGWETLHPAGVEAWRDVWVHATLFATECVLWVIKGWWIVVGLLLVVWLLAGLLADWKADYESRASIATGRLGIAVSFGMFLVVTMSIWAMLNGVLDSAVDGVGYRPCIFALDAPEVPAPQEVAYPANTCLWSNAKAVQAGAAAVPSAGAVLKDRYLRSTSTFSLLSALLVGLLLYLALMFVPRVLAELKLLVDRTRNSFQRTVEHRRDKEETKAAREARTRRARELGRWLTAGYRRLDLAVLGMTFVGVALCVGVAALFAGTLFDLIGQGSLFRSIERFASETSQLMFRPLIFSAAGLGAALTLLGGMLSRHVPSLRGPLDMLLDVDNHFREFPRSNIPRAHIFARYAALLDHIAAQGYERIVIVSHSQGTVISAELLRFLSSRDQRAPAPGEAPQRHGKPLPAISLLTLGCPLRQLYAARFPGLYGWVLARNGKVFGPRADDLGVRRWMNGFCSGDYVGRWLWSDTGHHATLHHPMVSRVAADPFGRSDIYAGFHPSPPDEALLRPAREVEVCLGLGAHTHYFERDQTTVAWMIDWLVRAPAIDATASDASARPVVEIDASNESAPAVAGAA